LPAVDPTPQEGVLLLRNGEVLEGKIVRVGDFYYVAVPNGQVRIRAADVEAACRTLQEGYRFKRQNIRLPSAQEHLNLGQWCIRHGLVEEAQQELEEALRLQPDHPLAALLRRRIEIAKQPGLFRPPHSSEGAAKNDSYELDHWVRSFPPMVIEQFTQSVQPILLNNCTAAGCHGPAEKGRFSLLKPPTGQLATRRLTQRNLASTLQWINPKEPLRSPLLTMPLGPHGSAKTPIFGNPQSEAYQRLVRWVLLAAGSTSPPEMLAKHAASGPTTAVGTAGGLISEHPSAFKVPASEVVPAVAVEETPQIVQQAGVWQPGASTTPAKGPLVELLTPSPGRTGQEGSVPPAFLPWAAVPNGPAMPAAGSATPIPSAGSGPSTPAGLANNSSASSATDIPSAGSPNDPAAANSAASPNPECRHRQKDASANPTPAAGRGNANPVAGLANDTLMAGSGKETPAAGPGTGTTALGSAKGLSGSPSAGSGRFSPPYRSEPKRGNPLAGQFRPVDPFDPEIFNRRYHPAEPTQ